MDFSEKSGRELPLKPKRNQWIDYLRSGITVLVIAHHSSLAYATFASFDKEVHIKSTNPIVDSQRWIGLDIFVSFNDIFFMFLMCFIGGLFLFKSIERKGTSRFILDRIFRLLLPFLILGTLFMFLAYILSYIVAYGHFDVLDYVSDFFTKQQWPVGPPWFVWVLFVFNILFAGLYPLLKTGISWVQLTMGRLQENALPFIGSAEMQGDAYMMINTLRKLGVEPQAIEQPLDLNIPENKMMLAIHLAAPEVENDRRALNVIYGMRRAMKEGRWLWKAPYGYKNSRTPEGRPTITLNEEEAKHMKWIFETIALGDYNTEQVLLQA